MVEIKGLDGHENDTVKLPNNIRQVGTPGDKVKIYLEDYVTTYLHQIASQKPFGQKAALLLGEKAKKDKETIFFVSAAIQMEPLEIHEDSFQVTAEMWSGLYECIEKYFGDRNILGWYLSRPGQTMEINSQIEKIQAEQFSEKGLLFYTADPMDREDAFYLYDRGRLVRQQGYYIYYDRNEAMQNYMIEMRGQEKEQDKEEQTRFQNRLFERKTDNKIKKESYGRGRQSSGRWFPQMAAALLVILVAAVIWKNMQIKSVTVNNRVSESMETEDSMETADSMVKDTVDIVDSVVQQAAESLADGESVLESADESVGESADESAETEGAVASSGVPGSYTVQAGDTLLKISRNFYQDVSHVEEIIRLNQIEDPDYIYPGMVLELP